MTQGGRLLARLDLPSLELLALLIMLPREIRLSYREEAMVPLVASPFLEARLPLLPSRLPRDNTLPRDAMLPPLDAKASLLQGREGRGRETPGQ